MSCDCCQSVCRINATLLKTSEFSKLANTFPRLRAVNVNVYSAPVSKSARRHSQFRVSKIRTSPGSGFRRTQTRAVSKSRTQRTGELRTGRSIDFRYKILTPDDRWYGRRVGTASGGGCSELSGRSRPATRTRHRSLGVERTGGSGGWPSKHRRTSARSVQFAECWPIRPIRPADARSPRGNRVVHEFATRRGWEPGGLSAPYRILVVDDNKDAAESMRMLLKLLGGDVRTAHDGLDALDLAEHFLPHAIVLDIGLPKLDGFQAARRIRSEDWGKNMVLVAVSGWCREEDRQNSADAGFDGHLAKPVPVEQIPQSDPGSVGSVGDGDCVARGS